MSALGPQLRQYLIVTGNYWAFTLTDGALRMLVVLHFHSLGYSPLEIALLFLFYEFFGVVTNLVGGWLGARIGLNRTMNIGLGLQIAALAMLLMPTAWLTVAWVMAAQALSGIAKDLNKMSAKSAIKFLLPADADSRLFYWVAILTGSKNALKGMGFFLGGLLLATLGFAGAVGAMAIGLTLVWLFSLMALGQDLGRASGKPKFTEIISKSRAINALSAARLFLFGARDVWFVVALPVFMSSQLGWSHTAVGSFLASWVVGYGLVQSMAPRLITLGGRRSAQRMDAAAWALALAALPALIALALSEPAWQQNALVGGLLLFGAVFAVNSSLHSYLIVRHARADGVSMDVGFYYMANAMGRLLGTVLSGWLYQAYGLTACLWASCVFLLLAAILPLAMPRARKRINSLPH